VWVPSDCRTAEPLICWCSRLDLLKTDDDTYARLRAHQLVTPERLFRFIAPPPSFAVTTTSAAVDPSLSLQSTLLSKLLRVSETVAVRMLSDVVVNFDRPSEQSIKKWQSM